MIRVPLPPSAHTKAPATKREWRESVRDALAQIAHPPSYLLTLTIELHGPWMVGGKLDPKMADLDRLWTPLQDALAEAVRFNDRQVWRASVVKVQSEDAYALVRLDAFVT